MAALNDCFGVVRVPPKFERRLYVTDLPDEVLLHILYNVDGEDIIRLRMTCQSFYRLSKERQLWVSALFQLIRKNHLPPSIPPTDCRSTDELEGVVVRHLRYRKNWLRSTPNDKNLKITKSSVGPQGWLLVPGGRWLIGLRENHQLCCWDLSGESIVECTELAQAEPDIDDGFCVGHLNSFLLEDGSGAIFAAVRQSLAPGSSSCFDFYSIDLSLPTPSARFRGSFDSTDFTPAVWVSRSWAICIMQFGAPYHFIVLFEWESFLSGVRFECGTSVLPPAFGLEFILPDGRIIGTCNGLIMLYPKPMTQMVATLDQPFATTFEIAYPLWTYDPQIPNFYRYASHETIPGEARQYLGCLQLHRGGQQYVCRLFTCGVDLEVYQTPISGLQVEWYLGRLTVVSQQSASTSQTWKLKVMNLEPVDFSAGFAEVSSGLESERFIVLDVKELNKDGSERISAIEFDEVSGQLFFIIHTRSHDLRVGTLDFAL